MTRRFSRVAVFMGGPSTEREISLQSGAAVARGLAAAGYEVEAVDLPGREVRVPAGVEAVFIALHGEFGEDGGIQDGLEAMGIPYTGSGPESSRRSFDKRLTKEALVRAGLPTPAYEVVRSPGDLTLPLPVVVKPPCQGSTIGISRVRAAGDWPGALAAAQRYGREAIVEAYIPGRELTVGLVGGEPLPVVEVRAPEGWYDYEAKYLGGCTEYLAPAPLEPARAERCRAVAREVFRALGCRGLGRVDFRMAEDGTLYVLELNSIPGFTEKSLLPKAAQVAGIGFAELCTRIMEMAALDARLAAAATTAGRG